MEIITFEIAKRLKEIGYPQHSLNEVTSLAYNDDGEIWEMRDFDQNPYLEYYSICTYLDVWLWLWREKKYRILLSASNQRWDEVHGIVDGVDGVVETSWHRGLPGYDATDHRANHTDPEEAIIAAIEYLVNEKKI